MRRLIDATPILEAMGRYRHKAWVDMVCNAIERAPTIDVAAVTRGTWIKQKCQGNYGLCSECECRIRWIPQNYKYCPNCGAKMEVRT